MSDTLFTGQVLNVNDSIISANNRFRLILQGDGNFVVYRHPQGIPLWHTRTNGKSVKFAIMQTDGNLVLYSPSNAPVWATMTVGHSNAKLVMQDDGNLVIYSGSTAVWSEPGVYQPRISLLATESRTVIDRLRVVAGWHGGLIPRPETKSEEAVYNPPPGWVVVSTNTTVQSSNNGSRSVSVIGGGLNLVTESELQSAYDSAIDVAIKYGKQDIKVALEEKRKEHLKQHSSFQSNLNTVRAKVTASGHGVPNHDQKRGWEEISVTAELLYIGTTNRDDIIASIEDEFGIDVP